LDSWQQKLSTEPSRGKEGLEKEDEDEEEYAEKENDDLREDEEEEEDMPDNELSEGERKS